MSYTVRPIDVWPGERSRAHRRSSFKTAWSSTARLLDRELAALGARNAVVMVAVSESDIRIDGHLRASARPTYPGVIIAFDSRHGPLKYMSDTFDDWQDNVRAIALGLEALRKVDRYGITKRGEQYTGWRALEAGPSATITPDEARAVFERYGSDWREALKATHPDHGGDPEAFQRVQEARRLMGATA